jgi:DNA helicase-2/ATP-dependent DNA helicase PcrA
LIGNGRINPDAGQQILIVTYLNASVDTFRARIRQRLDEMGLPPLGFDVRTLHSLANEIVRSANSGLGDDGNLVLDDNQANHFLAQAVDLWLELNPSLWADFLPDDSPQTQARWRDLVQRSAKAFIRTAKNERYRPEAILQKLEMKSLEIDNQSPNLSISQSPL